MMPKPMRMLALLHEAGMIVCSGRLRGASVFGWFFSSENRPPRFCSMKPVPGGTRPEPKPL